MCITNSFRPHSDMAKSDRLQIGDCDCEMQLCQSACIYASDSRTLHRNNGTSFELFGLFRTALCRVVDSSLAGGRGQLLETNSSPRECLNKGIMTELGVDHILF
jgi:hypothetical protein